MIRARSSTAFLLVLFLAVASAFADATKMDFTAFGDLAIQDGGRRKPVDTFAREAARKITGGESVKAFGKTWVPEDFLLSVMLGSRAWETEPIILANHKDLLAAIGLPPETKSAPAADLARNAKLQDLVASASELRRAGKQDALTRLQKEAESLAGRIALFRTIQSGANFTIFPSRTPGGAWSAPTPGSDHAALPLLTAMLGAYQENNAFEFTKQALALRAALRDTAPETYPPDSRLHLEAWYNRTQPFDWAAGAYLIALLLLCAAGRFRWMATAGIAVAAFGLAVHVGGIAARCIIAARPPVTNMYESVVWASLGTVVCGFIFLAVYRARIYLVCSLAGGFLCLLLVSLMPNAMPGEINPLVPVLRDNFWLVVHVLTIVSSYAVFLLGWALGHYILWGYVRNPAAIDADKRLHTWLYRVLQLGVLLLAAGTILGGVWANYSWGRFWGWDPKETWALIALLSYIFVMHGRLAGWWNHFGMAVASVLCFCAVLMTWYGVNFILGKGLHSYGFGIGGEGYVTAFVIADCTFVALAAWRHLACKPLPSQS